jgi:hypothetical protein
MSAFIEESADLLRSGPLVAVKLWVPQQVKTNLPPIDALAEVNIALAHTFIQEGIATSLGLEPIGIMTITTSTKPAYQAHLFRIRIGFPEGKMVFEVTAVEVPYMMRPHARIKCFIGRDILQFGILNYDGPASTFSLKF